MKRCVVSCDGNPVYNYATLFTLGNDEALVVIQQRYDPDTKHTWWGPIDTSIANELCESSDFLYFFGQNAKKVDVDGYYPVFTIRQVAHRCHLKINKKEPWETRF